MLRSCAFAPVLLLLCALTTIKPLSEHMHASRLPGNHVPVSDYHKPGANAHRRKQPTRSKPPRNELKQGRLVFSLQPQFKSKNMVTCVHMLLVCCVVCAKTTQQTRSMCTHVTMFLPLAKTPTFLALAIISGWFAPCWLFSAGVHLLPVCDSH